MTKAERDRFLNGQWNLNPTSTTFDALKTSDPADREACQVHGYEIPCRVCQQEAIEDRGDREREER